MIWLAECLWWAELANRQGARAQNDYDRMRNCRNGSWVPTSPPALGKGLDAIAVPGDQAAVVPIR